MEENLYGVAAGDGWLRTSPEFALKRVVAAGLPRIYEIGPCFRDREHGDWHRREFTMLEWYRAGAHLDDLMAEVEALIAAAADAMGVPAPASWTVVTVDALWADVVGGQPTEGDAFFRTWVEQIDPALHGMGAVFVTDWPAEQAALSRVIGGRAQRFEAYLHGAELANAFLELVDASEQRRRFEAARAVQIERGDSPHPVDEGLIDAVGRMPPTAGIAMGIDRLVAALRGWDGIARGRVERESQGS